MRTLYTVPFVLSFAVIAYSFTTSSDNPTELNKAQSVLKKKRFIQNVWHVIDRQPDVNKVFFYPQNMRTVGRRAEQGYQLDLLKEQKDIIKFNLWNIIIYHFLLNELTLYHPYEPDAPWNHDNGHLMFPLTPERYGQGANHNYFTDTIFQDYVKALGLIGEYDYSEPVQYIKSQVNPMMDSIDANGNMVYYPRDYLWFDDEDIVAYKIREEVEIDVKGKEYDRSIKAIAPMINEVGANGQIIGKRVIFWLDFEKLKTLLTDYYIFSEHENAKKVYSYKEVFDQRMFDTITVEKDTSFVKQVHE